ncbi:MAG: response regulator [Candidatus Binatia bacterium]
MSQPLILIVDDEDGVRESLKIVFSKNYRIQEANSVAVAVQKAREGNPAIVFLDILMPGADGLQALMRIKELNPHCQVIMLTALNTDRTASLAKEAGAFDYVVKPFDIEELRHKVEGALKKSREMVRGSGT